MASTSVTKAFTSTAHGLLIEDGKCTLDTPAAFKTPQRDKLWDYVWFARRFLQELPFWEMAPADRLLTGAGSITLSQSRGRRKYRMGAQVFAKPGKVYAVYLPKADPSGTLDLSAAKGKLTQKWYNPRTGEFQGATITLIGGSAVSLGTPPSAADEDWVVLIRTHEGR